MPNPKADIFTNLSAGLTLQQVSKSGILYRHDGSNGSFQQANLPGLNLSNEAAQLNILNQLMMDSAESSSDMIHDIF